MGMLSARFRVSTRLVCLQGMPLLAGTQVRLRRHGDEVARLPGRYYQALGRADDTMNLGGIKVIHQHAACHQIGNVSAVNARMCCRLQGGHHNALECADDTATLTDIEIHHWTGNSSGGCSALYISRVPPGTA